MKSKACLTTAQIDERLRAVKIRPTAQRLAICRYVLCEADHPTAEDVKRWADSHFSKMSLATVYNTLRVLVRGGLLKEFRLPHSGATVYDDNIFEHHHFLDERTGQVEDIPVDAVRVKVRLGGKYVVRNVQVVLRGVKG
jgi:Fur family iron response transcriptional regulator